MPWTYCSDTGDLFNPKGQLFLVGYAGHGTGLNNPKEQSVHDIGPLPCNMYEMVTFIDSPHTGLGTIVLKAAGSMPMYNRDGFRIHGDNEARNQTASDGCIVAGHYNERKAMWESLDHRVLVALSRPNAVP